MGIQQKRTIKLRAHVRRGQKCEFIKFAEIWVKVDLTCMTVHPQKKDNEIESGEQMKRAASMLFRC